MIFAIRRCASVLGAAVACGLVLAGCGSGPGQVGNAAIVGDTAVPLSQIQQQVNGALTGQRGAELRSKHRVDDTARELVGFAVQHELVTRAARKDGVRVDPRRVQDVLNAQGGARTLAQRTPLDEAGVRSVMHDQLLMVELGRKHAATDTVTVDYTHANTRAQAQDRARRMAQSAEQAHAVVRADVAAGTHAAVGAEFNGADLPGLMASTPLFGARTGTVQAFQSTPNNNVWTIARIEDRSVHPPASTPALAGVNLQQYREIGRALLGRTAQRVGVRISPRYGAWDPVGLQPVPAAGQTVGVQIDPPEQD